jgi:hypothetical protein
MYTPYYPIKVSVEFSDSFPVHSSLLKKSKYFEDRPTDRPTDMTRYRCFLSKHKKYVLDIINIRIHIGVFLKKGKKNADKTNIAPIFYRKPYL